MGIPPVRDSSLETYGANAPVIVECELNLNRQEELKKPIDCAHQNGTVGKNNHDLSMLQQHVAFFDRNNDGKVYPWETYKGLRAIGCHIIQSFLLAFLINLMLSYPTQERWMPSPLLSIRIKNIHKGKHGSDSETYDTDGRFDPSKFDAIFSKYALTYPSALTWKELNTMIRGNRNYGDFIGWGLSLVEWWLLYQVGKDEQGLLSRETIRGLYDGSLFEQLESRRITPSRRDQQNFTEEDSN